jgi:hypothetical protein
MGNNLKMDTSAFIKDIIKGRHAASEAAKSILETLKFIVAIVYIYIVKKTINLGFP